MPKKFIHVNQHVIKENAKTGKREKVISVKTYKDNLYGNEFIINGPSRIVYRPDNPLSCGAKVYIIVEEDVEVELIDETPMCNC